MKNIKELIEKALKWKNLIVDEIKYEKVKTNQLNIVLDSEAIINIDMIVEATKIINEILDKEDVIKESYLLDVSSKEKGEK